ncbi:DUF6456 domain-containing protein [Agrobacterium sp. NPDC089420]|uniref:DUF6456 domain-containing protein n=1 Tax=Agrobacterium sp. NPDC089420 TaxID=3363918 RepID=UPI00384DCAC9
MSELNKAPVACANAALLRLLRRIATGAAEVTQEGDETILRRTRPGQDALRFPAETVRFAVSAGLLRRQDNILSAAPPLASYLKRAMAKDREEIFQEQHRDMRTVVVDVDETRQSARQNLNTAPLISLSRLKERNGKAFFPAEALEAGERLAADFHRGHLNPRVTATWEPRMAKRTKGEAGGMPDLTEAAMAARARFSRAAEAMGPELSGVAIDICCFEKGLETVERERLWPARSAKLLLRAALLSLARHYAPPATPAGGKGHHWGDADYRPSMAARSALRR